MESNTGLSTLFCGVKDPTARQNSSGLMSTAVCMRSMKYPHYCRYDNTEILLHPKAPARRKASRVGRVNPCAPQTQIRSPIGAHGLTRPT